MNAQGQRAFLNEAKGLLEGFPGINDECVGMGTGNESAAFPVSAVDETLRNETNPSKASLMEPRTGLADHRKPPAGRRQGQHPGDFRIVGRLMVKRPMRLDVNDTRAGQFGNRHEGADLVFHQGGQFIRRKRDGFPPHAGLVGMSGVRADRHPRLRGGAKGPKTGRRIAGMQAATDVGGTDDLQQFAIETRTLAQIGIDVDAAHGQAPFGRNAETTPGRVSSLAPPTRSMQ